MYHTCKVDFINYLHPKLNTRFWLTYLSFGYRSPAFRLSLSLKWMAVLWPVLAVPLVAIARLRVSGGPQQTTGDECLDYDGGAAARTKRKWVRKGCRASRRWRKQPGRRGEKVKDTRWVGEKTRKVCETTVAVKVTEDNSAYPSWKSVRENPISKAPSSLDRCWQGASEQSFVCTCEWGWHILSWFLKKL